MAVFALLVLAAPLLLLATAVVALVRAGPLGAVAAALLLWAVAVASRLAGRLVRRWWRSTKAPRQVRQTPAQRRAQPRP